MAILRTLLAFLRALLASRACLVAESLTLAAWSAVLFTSESRWCHRALTAPDGQALAPRPGGDHPGLSPIGDGSPFKCQRGEPNNRLGRDTSAASPSGVTHHSWMNQSAPARSSSPLGDAWLMPSPHLGFLRPCGVPGRPSLAAAWPPTSRHTPGPAGKS